MSTNIASFIIQIRKTLRIHFRSLVPQRIYDSTATMNWNSADTVQHSCSHMWCTLWAKLWNNCKIQIVSGWPFSDHCCSQRFPKSTSNFGIRINYFTLNSTATQKTCRRSLTELWLIFLGNKLHNRVWTHLRSKVSIDLVFEIAHPTSYSTLWNTALLKVMLTLSNTQFGANDFECIPNRPASIYSLRSGRNTSRFSSADTVLLVDTIFCRWGIKFSNNLNLSCTHFASVTAGSIINKFSQSIKKTANNASWFSIINWCK